MSSEASIDRLIRDLRAVVEDADALLRATAGEAGEKVQQARSRAEQTVRAARERLSGLERDVAQASREAAQQADRYVHEKPWQAVATAAGIALIIGLILGRR